MLKKIVIGIAVIVAAVLAFAATKPDTFHFERSTTITASPEKIAALVTDFRQWRAWSPWENLDPQMQRTYSGPERGPGAVYEWSGNSSAGQGRMEVLSESEEAIEFKLDFLKPMATSNTLRFALTPHPQGTEVVWSMDGPMPYISKLLTVFVSMDTLLAKDFEKGLVDLKAAAEQG
jgi:hypothetical protein